MENQLVVQTQFDIFNPTQFETMQRVCKMYASSELVPEMYRATDKNSENKAMANCMIAIEMSQRIGASALMIMQNMVIIYGKPSWSSKFLIATVNTCGRFNPLQYKFSNLGKLGKISYTSYDKKWIDGKDGKKGFYKSEAVVSVFDGTNIDNIQCIAFTNQRGSEQILESSPISIELAIKEGWYTKAGSKWQTMPQQMLTYRAASFWTSAYAPELSMGMRTTDEMEDIGEIIDAKFEDISLKVENEIKEKANKGKSVAFENETKPPIDNNPPEQKGSNLNKLKELGYLEEDIKAMSPANEMNIIMNNITKGAGF